MYYLYIDDQQRGPFSIEQLAEMGITPETEVWTEGMADWKQAGDVPALTTLLQRLEYERHSAASRPASTPPKHNPMPPVPPAWGEPTAAAPATQPAPKRKGCATKLLIALLILCVLFGVLVVTVPDREAHRQAIVGSSREWVGEKVEERNMGDILGEVIKWVSGKGADIAIDQLLQVDNHFVYSTGKLMVGEKPKTISLGILGHVFTFGKDDIDQVLQEAMGIDMSRAQEPSVGVTPPPASEPDEPAVAPDDTLGSVMPREDDEPYDPTQAMLDSLAEQTKREAIRVAKEWAKKQIDNL